jgi:hypothetical protein
LSSICTTFAALAMSGGAAGSARLILAGAVSQVCASDALKQNSRESKA